MDDGMAKRFDRAVKEEAAFLGAVATYSDARRFKRLYVNSEAFLSFVVPLLKDLPDLTRPAAGFSPLPFSEVLAVVEAGVKASPDLALTWVAGH